MATYTSNYGWTKPSGSDQVNISVLNDNLDSQDSIMHDAFLNMAEPFSELSTYSVGDIVLYGTKTYKCRVAVTTAGSWTGATNWDEYKLSEGGGASGGEVKNLDNGMLSHSTDSSYITVNLAVALTAGKEYKITLRDPAYNYVDTKQILWTSTVEVNFPGTGSSGEYKISLTQTTVSLFNYGGQGWRDIYCDIVSDFETVTAAQTTYDNTDSGLSATDVQGAVDELAGEKADKSDITALVNLVAFTQSSGGAVDVSAGNYVDVIIDTYSAPSGYSFLGIAYFSAHKTGLSVNSCGMSSGALHIIIRNDTSSNITGARPTVRVAFVKSEYIVR